MPLNPQLARLRRAHAVGLGLRVRARHGFILSLEGCAPAWQAAVFSSRGPYRHSDRSEPISSSAFAPANASARVVEESLFDFSAPPAMESIPFFFRIFLSKATTNHSRAAQ